MDMRIRLRMWGGRKVERPNTPTYVGMLIIGDAWVSKTQTRFCARLVTHDGHQLDIVPRLYEPQIISMLTDGFLLRGFEDHKAEGDRQMVMQEWTCEVIERTSGEFDQKWHPRMEADHRKAGRI